jgi:hypothetical protein
MRYRLPVLLTRNTSLYEGPRTHNLSVIADGRMPVPVWHFLDENELSQSIIEHGYTPKLTI